jgi:hypothetical protein
MWTGQWGTCLRTGAKSGGQLVRTMEGSLTTGAKCGEGGGGQNVRTDKLRKKKSFSFQACTYTPDNSGVPLLHCKKLLYCIETNKLETLKNITHSKKCICLNSLSKPVLNFGPSGIGPHRPVQFGIQTNRTTNTDLKWRKE